MSATLTGTIESLHVAAAQKLLDLLQTEKDPHLLAKLIATAFRFKLPTPSRASKSHAPTPPPTPPAPINPSTFANCEEDVQEGSHVSPPPPYTDEQYLALIKQYGHAEAARMRTRRFAIIAELARENRASSS